VKEVGYSFDVDMRLMTNIAAKAEQLRRAIMGIALHIREVLLH
jgi:hypothetical protein